MRMQTWKRTMIGSHSHVGSQALGEVRHRGLLILWRSFQMVCKATFNSSVVLDFAWSLWYFSSMNGTLDVIVQRIQSWGHLFFTMNPAEIACGQFCTCTMLEHGEMGLF